MASAKPKQQAKKSAAAEDEGVDPTLCRAHTDLNDPVVQDHRFADQLQDPRSGDDEAMALDETFCTALDYGLPPTGGWGFKNCAKSQDEPQLSQAPEKIVALS